MSGNLRHLSDLSCNELENIIFEFLEKYEKYAEMINPQADHAKFLQHIVNYKVIVKSKKGDYENTKENFLGILSFILSFYNEKLQIKAKDFIKSVVELLAENVDVYVPILEKQQQIQNIIKSNDIIRNKPINDAGDVEAALQLHVRETEDMQYALMNILPEENRSNLDLEEILSIQGKVRRSGTFVTDSTAIRICISHSLYQIIDNRIVFDNHKDGFDYHQEFTFKELQDFLGLKGQLYALFFDLIDLLYLGDLTKIFFRRCGKNSKQ